MMNSIWQDVRYGMRMLWKTPIFTAIMVLTLAIGIGANTAIFSLIHQVLLQPLPYSNPDRLVTLWESNPEKGVTPDTTSRANFIDWRERNSVFTGMAAASRLGSVTITSGNPAEEITWSQVSPNFFDLLGVYSQFGRVFFIDEERPDKNRVVVLSHGLWLRRFGGDPGVVGQVIHLDKERYQVVGIMPQAFRSPAGDADLWVPLAIDPAQLESIDRGQNYLKVFARLKVDVGNKQAQHDLDRIAGQLSMEFPISNSGRQIRIIPLRDRLVGRIEPALWIALSAVAVVLLIACVNIASLLLTRFSKRSREISIRTALGASKIRVLRQLLVESILLSSFGGIAGILLARWGVNLLLVLEPGVIPTHTGLQIDKVTLLFALSLSVIIGILFGILPALRSSALALTESWKIPSAAVTEGLKDRRLRNRFVVIEIALTLLLLIASGLLIRSFIYLRTIHPGFEPDKLLVARIRLDDDYSSNKKQIRYFQELTYRLRNIAGIQDAAAVTVLPMNPFGIDFDVPYYREGEPEPDRAQGPKAKFRSATPEYFRTMRIPLLQGRSFQETDHPDAPRVVIVNQVLANRMAPNGSPVGKNVRFFWADWQTYEIIGVVGNTRSYGPLQAVEPELFVPHSQIPYIVMNVVVRAASDPDRISSVLREEVLKMDPNQPVNGIYTMNALVADSVSRERFAMFLVTLLSGIALLLAILGVYGSVYFAVTQRTREIGIRLALGATSRDILKILLRPIFLLTTTGIALGLISVVVLTRFLSSLLFGVNPTDFITLLAASLFLGVAALLASCIPAIRATKLDPVRVLQFE